MRCPMTRRAFLGLAAALAGTWGGQFPILRAAGSVEGRTQALRLLRQFIKPFAAQPGEAWLLVHGIRAFGKGFRATDDRLAVDYVLGNAVRIKKVAGGELLFVPQDVEAHTNSFLETLLTAGVPWSQPVRVDGRAYTVRDLFDHARLLFSFTREGGSTEGHHSRDNFAWSLIAFPFGVAPVRDGWTNAYGEAVDVAEILERGLRVLEEATASLAQAMRQGTLPAEKSEVHALTSGGAHLLSGVISAVSRGFTKREALPRLRAQLDILVYRLRAEPALIERFYAPIKAPQKALYELETLLYFLSHAFENLNWARRLGLFQPTAPQQEAMRTAQGALFRVVERLQSVNLKTLRETDRDLFHRFVGDSAYAYRALSLLDERFL